jgi:UDP-3-O-[3-hydroxymyristoyl] glucosamine N-acyltransferase
VRHHRGDLVRSAGPIGDDIPHLRICGGSRLPGSRQEAHHSLHRLVALDPECGESTVAAFARTKNDERTDSCLARRPGRIRSATATDISFVRDGSFAHLARDSAAGALFVTELLDTQASQIVVEDAHAAFAQVALLFHPVPKADTHQTHPSATVHESAEIGNPVAIGPNVVIGAGVKIGDRTSIQAGTVIGDNVRIGDDCTIYPRVVVYPNVQIGNDVILHAGVVLGTDGFGYVVAKDGTRHKFPQLGGLVVGDRVEIGANSTIDRGALRETVIGAGTKIDNLCHIAHNCRIGEDCGISGLSALGGGVELGDRVVLAGHVTATHNIQVTDDVLIGGNSGVTSSVRTPGVYLGFPLLPIGAGRRSLVLLKQLPRIDAELKALRRELEQLAGD